MFINDLFIFETSIIEPTPDGYSTETDDQTILSLSDMRKTRLTLSQLNKLRMMNDVKTIEHEQKLKTLASQYKPPVQDDSGGMGM